MPLQTIAFTRPLANARAEQPVPRPPDPGDPYPVPDPGVPYPVPDPGEPYPVPDPGDPPDDPEAD